MPALPFDDSRRLTGANLFFPATGAVLEVIGREHRRGAAGRLARARAARSARTSAGHGQAIAARPHASGTSLAITAPVDQLYLATEVNEWALCAALIERDPQRWSRLGEAWVAEALRAAEAAESGAGSPRCSRKAPRSRVRKPVGAGIAPAAAHAAQAAGKRRVPHVLDEELLTLGAGRGGRRFSARRTCPRAAALAWGGSATSRPRS